MTTRKRHTPQERKALVAMIPQKTVEEVAKIADVQPATVRNWRRSVNSGPSSAVPNLVVPPQSPPNYSFTPHEDGTTDRRSDFKLGDRKIVPPPQESEEDGDETGDYTLTVGDHGMQTLSFLDCGEHDDVHVCVWVRPCEGCALVSVSNDHPDGDEAAEMYMSVEQIQAFIGMMTDTLRKITDQD